VSLIGNVVVLSVKNASRVLKTIGHITLLGLRSNPYRAKSAF
jgi:hypothetical protein